MLSTYSSQPANALASDFHDEVPLAPDTGWGTEVRDLMKKQNMDFDSALALVFKRYFDEGDCRPLIDAKGRALICLGPKALRFVCALLYPEHESNPRLNYRAGFAEIRKKGKPAFDLKKEKRVERLLIILEAGIKKMTASVDPGTQFWVILLAALEPAFRKSKFDGFPLQARLESKIPRRGRRKDPELEIRDAVLSSYAKEAIDRGDDYESAIACTKDMIERFAASDPNWRGSIREKTVRAAYDKFGAKART